jgi:hypothetical protein
MKRAASVGTLERPTGETGFETFEVRRTTLLALLFGSAGIRFGIAFCLGALTGTGIGFLFGIAAVVSW